MRSKEKEEKIDSECPLSIYLNAQLHDFFYKECGCKCTKRRLVFTKLRHFLSTKGVGRVMIKGLATLTAIVARWTG